MGQSFKALCSLALIAAIGVTAAAWLDVFPNRTTWIARVVSPLIALALVGVLLKLHRRQDRVPDYLQAATGAYFNRDGFCFSFATSVADGVCLMHAYFQNQFECPCLGRIALRPSRGFFLNRAKIEMITFEILCEAAAFGVATLPIALPRNVHGKSQSFEVGAAVEYPDGKGQRLRYRDGIFLRTNTNFGSAFGAAVKVLGAMSGHIVLSKPASVTISLPTEVAEVVSSDAVSEIKTLWKLGDPALVA